MEIKKQGETNEVAIIDSDQLKQFQSLYYLIKGKRDTDIKLFTEYKQFSYDDITELNDKIYTKLNLHELVTNMVNVTVGLDNKEIKSFGNWNEFIETDWKISARTKYISIVWDFNLILPNQQHKIPQTHTLRVRIGNSLKPSDMIHVVFQGGDEYDLEEAQAQMSCKIDFINAQICNELKTIVSDWYEALPKNSEEQTVIKRIIKHDDKLRHLLIFFFITAGVIFLNFVYQFVVSNSYEVIPENPEAKQFFILSLAFPLIYIFYQSGILYSDRMMRKQINKLKRNPMFEITKGDQNQFLEVKKSNKKHVKGLIITLLIGILINGISALLGYILTNYVGG